MDISLKTLIDWIRLLKNSASITIIFSNFAVKQLKSIMAKLNRIRVRTNGTDVPKNVSVNVSNLASMLGVSEKTIKRDFAAMQSVGIIKRVGSDKIRILGDSIKVYN